MQTTSSPCLAICRIDPASGLCIGCARSATEIGSWVALTEPERLAVMATLAARFEANPALQSARADWEAALAARGRTGRRRNR